MKLLCSPASPYSAKVRMAARHLGIDLVEIKVDTVAGPAELIDNNPLGKIPTLLTDDGLSVFDSRVIMHHFHRTAGKTLYPKGDEARTEAEIFEALCDGVGDCLLAIVYERRMRPEEKLHQPWIDRQWEKVNRGLDRLEKLADDLPKDIDARHFALAALVGYLMLRFAGQWEQNRPRLAAFPAKFEKRFPDWPQYRPQ